LLTLVVVADGCASGRKSPNRELVFGVTTPIAPEIRALPDSARYAWVAPTALLGNLKAPDVESTRLGSVRSLREDINTLVRSRAWADADTGEAEYLLSFVQVHRSGRPPTATQAPVGRSAGVPPCRGTQGESPGVTCRRVVLATNANVAPAWMVLLIRRRSDGAQFTQRAAVMDGTVESRGFVESTLKLFLAGEK
jgi:hypothetical protein